MLSSSPAVPIQSINFPDPHRRRLSLVTGHGQEIFTAHDGLPSPEHLTPISGTPYAVSPAGSEAASNPISRRGSAQGYTGEDGASLRKVPSRGGLWHDEVSQIGCVLWKVFWRILACGKDDQSFVSLLEAARIGFLFQTLRISLFVEVLGSIDWTRTTCKPEND